MQGNAFFDFSVCCIVTDCTLQLVFNKKQNNILKHVHLVTDDGYYNRKAFCKVKS